MKNEVLILLFAFLIVSSYVSASLYTKRSTLLNKSTYKNYYAMSVAVNYCGANQQPARPNYKNKVIAPNPSKINNKILLNYKNNIIYPDDPQDMIDEKLQKLKINTEKENLKKKSTFHRKNFSFNNRNHNKNINNWNNNNNFNYNQHNRNNFNNNQYNRNNYNNNQYNRNNLNNIQYNGNNFNNNHYNFNNNQFNRNNYNNNQYNNNYNNNQFNRNNINNNQINRNNNQYNNNNFNNMNNNNNFKNNINNNNNNAKTPEDNLNPNKFFDAPGNIPDNVLDGKNYITLNDSGVQKLLRIITPQRWKKDHSKEKANCFADLPAYNQGGCGSCFIFAGVSYFSITRCLATGQFTSFSHQDMVNCSPPFKSSPNNCKGGLPKYTWEYMFANGVLEQSCQCYESFDGRVKQCNRNVCKYGGQPKLTKPETKDVIHMRNINMLAYIIENLGPLWAGISINAGNVGALNNFNQGVQGKVKYDLNTLFGSVAKSGKHAGHAVVIVGYRVR